MKEQNSAREIDDSDTLPTPERLRQGPVDGRDAVLTYDRDGRPSISLAPRAVDTIGRMLRRGSITEDMAKAALQFRSDFRRAAFPDLRAADMARVSCRHAGGGEMSNAAVRARQVVFRAFDAIGTPAADCIWHVVGLEHTIKEWANRTGHAGRGYSEEAASGILIAGLGALAKHYGISK